MTVELHQQAEGQVLEVRLSGKLQKEDYTHFVPEVEQLIEKHGKISLIMIMDNFHGWSAGALWEDVKLDFKHGGDIERIAMVGEKSWQQGMARFCKPFTSAQIRYFEPNDVDSARQWVHEGVPAESAHE